MRIRKGLLLSTSCMQTVSHTALVSDPQLNQKVKLEYAYREEDEEENGAGTSCTLVDERRVDVDTKILLKKRKGPVVENESQETLMLEKAKRIKFKTNKKRITTSLQQNDGEQDKVGNDDSKSINNNMNGDKKTNKRGGAIMEGSRCSRVNGRGWRCCQQTILGYSFCEHHLGKGGLRSITSMKGCAKMPTAAPTTAPRNDSTDNTTNDEQPAKKVLSSSPSVVQPAADYYKKTILLDGNCYDNNEDKEEDEEYDAHPLLVKKKRMKLGMVKARSLSSLLN